MSVESGGSSAGSARATDGGRFGRGAEPPSEGKHEFAVIGRPLPKIDAWAKVTGETRYADDFFLPRMAYGRLLRSPHAHARIRSIDATRARALPGVYAVITGADLPRVKFGILPVSQDEEALCTEKVRMVGDAVAAVAAVDEETADHACRLIDVEYEPLRALMSIEESLAHPEVRIHEYGDGPNVHKNVALQFGDVEAAFARADLVREDVFFYEGNTHLPMEQHAAVASAGPDGKLTLWSSTQTPHYVHRLLAKILEMPAAHIRVVATPVGGGFGGKLDPFAHEIAACRLSQLTGRPVKIACTREEVFYIHRGRHPVLMWIKTGFTKHPPRAPSGAHVDQDRLHEARRDHRLPPPNVARRRRVWLLRRGVDLLHGRHQPRHVQDPRLQVRGRARLHQQAALRPQARPRHAAAALRARVPDR